MILDDGTATEIFQDDYLTEDSVGATIADAMSAVAAMDETYLWVDRLCIKQDNRTEMETTTSQMDLIYNQSGFTTVAVAGQDTTAGLLVEHQEPGRFKQAPLQPHDLRFLPVISPSEHHNDYTSRSKWPTRSWTF